MGRNGDACAYRTWAHISHAPSDSKDPTADSQHVYKEGTFSARLICYSHGQSIIDNTLYYLLCVSSVVIRFTSFSSTSIQLNSTNLLYRLIFGFSFKSLILATVLRVVYELGKNNHKSV